LICVSEEKNGINIYEILDLNVNIIYFIENMHNGFIVDFCLLRDNVTLISTGTDKKVRVWDIDGEKEIKVLPT
jgi:WD40 repeat protein